MLTPTEVVRMRRSRMGCAHALQVVRHRVEATGSTSGRCCGSSPAARCTGRPPAARRRARRAASLLERAAQGALIDEPCRATHASGRASWTRESHCDGRLAAVEVRKPRYNPSLTMRLTDFPCRRQSDAHGLPPHSTTPHSPDCNRAAALYCREQYSVPILVPSCWCPGLRWQCEACTEGTCA